MEKEMIDLIATNTEDAYGRNRYTEAAWRRIAKALVMVAGASQAEAEWVLRSKHMRWAADDAGRRNDTTANHFLTYANRRKGKEGTGLAGLVLAARKELAAVNPKTGFPANDKGLAGACSAEDITELIDLARMVGNGATGPQVQQLASSLLVRIEIHERGGR